MSNEWDDEFGNVEDFHIEKEGEIRKPSKNVKPGDMVVNAMVPKPLKIFMHLCETIEFKTAAGIHSYKKFSGDNFIHFNVPHAGTYILRDGKALRIPDSGEVEKRVVEVGSGKDKTKKAIYVGVKLQVLDEIGVKYSKEYQAEEEKEIKASKMRQGLGE